MNIPVSIFDIHGLIGTNYRPKKQANHDGKNALTVAVINTNGTALYTPPKTKLEQVTGLEPATFSLGS